MVIESCHTPGQVERPGWKVKESFPLTIYWPVCYLVWARGVRSLKPHLKISSDGGSHLPQMGQCLERCGRGMLQVEQLLAGSTGAAP